MLNSNLNSIAYDLHCEDGNSHIVRFGHEIKIVLTGMQNRVERIPYQTTPVLLFTIYFS